MTRPAFKPFLLAATLLALAGPQALHAQQPTLDSAFLAGYSWRNLGPDRGGRSIAVSGVMGRPEEAYFGATGGGLWKTTNGGDDWHPVTDFQITSASVGAVAVSESDPDLVFIGTGETCIRGNILPGDGVYRSRDAGETWEHVGFAESHGISKIRIHPTDPDIIYVASFGKYGVTSEERGVFRSTDGGDSWERVLFRDERTGAIDLALDRNNPDVLYASLWEAFRKEYTMSSGGPGSGMFKSVDGGDTWTEITRNPGMPQEGVVGRIGVAVSSANSNRVYSLFENDDGGLFRSDDGGDTWELINDERRIRQRAFYYTHVFADHHDEDVVYVQNTSFFHSTDGGATYEVINNGTHGDFHDFWLDPGDPAHGVVGNDGGGAVSFTTGSEWTDQEFSHRAVLPRRHDGAHPVAHLRVAAGQQHAVPAVGLERGAVRVGAGGHRGRLRGQGAGDHRGLDGRLLPGGRRRAGLHRARSRGPGRLLLGHEQRPLHRQVQPAPGHLARGQSVPLVLLRRAGQRHGRALAMDLSDHLFAHRPEHPVRVVEPAVADHRRRHQLGRAERRPDPRGPHDAGPFGRADHR